MAEVKDQLHHLQAQTNHSVLREDLAAEELELNQVELLFQDKEMMVVVKQLVVLLLDLAAEEKMLRVPRLQVVAEDPVVMV